MAKEIDKQLDEILNIESDIKEKTQVVKLPERSENIETDYRYARENLYGLVERGQDAIDGILELAKESEHPRTYEVAGQLIQTVSQVSQDLLGLQSRLKRLKEVPNNAPKNVTNALYVGSTNELQKLLKKTKKNDGESES